MERVRPTDAFIVLFSSASSWPAYGSRRGGAYGRLAAWDSVGGLTLAPEGEAVEDLASGAMRSAWFWLEPASGWFYQVAWDFGLVAVAEGGMSLAVLAATDTD